MSKKIKINRSREGISERRDYVTVLAVSVLVCGRFGFSVWPFWFVAILDAIRGDEVFFYPAGVAP